MTEPPLVSNSIIPEKRQNVLFLQRYIRLSYILLNDFTCREIRLHNADRFNRMIALGSIQRYAV